MFRKYVYILSFLCFMCVFFPALGSSKTLDEYITDALAIEGYVFVRSECSDIMHFTVQCKVETTTGVVTVICQKTLVEGNDPFRCWLLKH